jgi:hypothetical protein
MGKGGQLTKENIKNKKEKVIGIEYAYKKTHGTGIRWRVYNMDTGKNFRIYSVQAIITPMVLLNKDYINIATELDIQNFKSAFNNEARKISPILEDFDSYTMSRSDYCANFDLEELNIPCTPEQMMMLIKRGDIPTHFSERYNPISHRKKSDKDNFYLKSGSVVVNCYDKYEQLKKDPKHPCPNKEDAKNIIRFEIQCKYPKLYAMSKNYMQVTTDPEPPPPQVSIEDEMYEFYEELLIRRRRTLPADAFLSNTISFDMIGTYFRRIVRSGDYYTLAKAMQMIESLDCQPKRKEKLINALKMTNSCRGIYNTKLRLSGKDLLEYNRLLIDLDKLRINPVTIPRNWSVEHIPNLLNAYYDKCAEVRNEESMQRLMEHFAKHNKKWEKVKKKHIFSSLR